VCLSVFECKFSIVLYCMSNFWWPGIRDEVTRYCRSCNVCQRTILKERVSKAPLQKMPIIDVPFQRIGVDLVGPIIPASSSGKRYILTVVDYATRYLKTVALSGISTEEVAEAPCTVYSRLSIPTHVVPDQGSQFMSEVMAEVSRLLSIRNLVSTPYHPQTNGLVERFNGTLKAMLKKLCVERPKDWDRYLESVLFAYREVKQEKTGFSPFELLYGHTVRGPMAILRELWTKEQPIDEVRTTYQYVLELRNRLEETCRMVKDSLAESSVKSKKHFDRKTHMRELKAGDCVLILLPTAESKLLMQWKGPYVVTEQVGLTDYRIRTGETEKVYYINMLKKYYKAASHSESGVSKPLNNSNDTAIAEEMVATLVKDEEDTNATLPVSSSPRDVKETVVLFEFTEYYKGVAQPHNANKDSNIASKVDLLMTANNIMINYVGYQVTVQNVYRCISKMKLHKAEYLDNITSEHLRYGGPHLAVHLCLLFNCMMHHCFVPREFCKGIILPLLKNKHGDATDINRYRGITLSPVILKLFEAVLLHLYNEFLSSDSLQFGFKKTVAALMLCLLLMNW